MPGPAAPPAPPKRRAGALRFAAAIGLVALLAAGFAAGFRAGLATLLHTLWGASDVVSAMVRAPWGVRLLLPALGGLLAGGFGRLVARGSPGRGVGEIMEAVVLGSGRPSLPATLLKSLASFCAIGSGGSLGREGPLIRFGGAAGGWLGDHLGLTANERRIAIAAGSAAGFAAAYNTPLAAVLFVLEIVLGVAALEALVPVVVATALATLATRLLVGAGPLYGARSFTLISPAELLAFAALGLVAAVAAQGFMRLLSVAERLFRARQGRALPLPFRPALGGLVAGAVIVFLPEVAGNGYEPLNEVLDGAFSSPFLVALVAAKMVATTASVSSGSPGGVFTPTLLLGGGVGALFGGALGALFGGAVGPAGGYALVGMAAATGATTHAPLMAAVMAFELSGDYAIVLPLLLATAVATAASRQMRRDSIYMAELRERGVAWELTLEGRRSGPEA